MTDDMRILINREAISRMVQEMAARISADHAGQEVVLVCILKAALFFTADLMRELSIPASVEFIGAMSYGSSTTSSGAVVLSNTCDLDLAGKHVVLVDTIIDTGETLHALLDRFRELSPASLEVAVLLDKEPRRTKAVPVTYRGGFVPDEFVVGYGMDYDGRYRNLPDIAVVKTNG